MAGQLCINAESCVLSPATGFYIYVYIQNVNSPTVLMQIPQLGCTVAWIEEEGSAVTITKTS